MIVIFVAYSVSIKRTGRFILAVAVGFFGYKSPFLKYLKHVI